MRRQTLAMVALVAALVLAGCSAAGSLEMEPAPSDSVLATESSVNLDVGPHSGERILGEEEHEVAVAAIENGSTNVTGDPAYVDPDLPYAYEGAYYRVNRSVVASETGTSAEVAIDYNGTTDAEPVAYENLSAYDRVVLEDLFPPRTDGLNEGFDMGTRGTYNESARNRSVLLDRTPEAIAYEGEVYPMTVRDRREVEIETYRYESTLVYNSSEAYADDLRERYLFTLSGLSDAEREIVEEALNETYWAESDDDEAFASLLDRFQAHEPMAEDDRRGTWLVRYDGAVYVADVGYEGFDVE